MGQIEGLIHNGAYCKGYFLTTHTNEQQKLNEHINYYPIEKPASNLFYQLKLKKKYIKALQDILNESSAEYVYLRYAFASKALLKMIQSSNKKFIIERNSKSLEEITSLCKEEKFGLNISSILGKIQDCFIPFFNEKLYSKKISAASYLTVGVTQELAKHYQPQTNKRICIPNGINVKAHNVRNNLPFKQGEKCVFLIMDGTSTPAPWQGLDRLIQSVYKHQLAHMVEIRIAGNKRTIYSDSFVHQLGFLEGEELEKAFNEAHIGTGNLCLFRKNLKEGSVLKNREYAVRGLPILYAMDDEDFDQTELAHFSFKVSNSNETINLPMLLSWIANLYATEPKLAMKIHNSARSILNFNTKMKRLTEFIECKK